MSPFVLTCRYNVTFGGISRGWGGGSTGVDIERLWHGCTCHEYDRRAHRRRWASNKLNSYCVVVDELGNASREEECNDVGRESNVASRNELVGVL